MLRALGVDGELEDLYLALLANPAADVEDLAGQLKRTEHQIRAALDALAELALLRPSRTDPGRMVPLTPPLALDAIHRIREEQLASLRREIDQRHAAAARFIAEYKQSFRPDALDTERVLGLDAIQARLDELVSTAQTEILSLVPGRAIPAPTLAASAAADAAFAERGVACRVLYQDSVRNDPATLGYGRWMLEHGTQIRTTPVLPQRLLIVDRRVALLPLDPATPGDAAICTTAPGMIGQFVTLFEMIWSTAEPLDAVRSVEPETALTGTERELLRMLAEGYTDEATANRLGVSTRTVSRMMADVMKRLEASSRFEAGLKAAKRGWL